MKCICEDWKENIPKINSPLSFIAASRPQMLEGLDLGKEFVYCPWCGFKLLNEDVPPDTGDLPHRPLE